MVSPANAGRRRALLICGPSAGRRRACAASPRTSRARRADADRRELRAHLGALGRRRGGEALAQAAVARVDAELAAGLRIDEPELADVRQLLLARVADLDRDHVVTAGELEQRPAPVARPAEVGDDDDERALARERARRARAPRRARSRRARVRLRLAAECREQARRARRGPARGGSACGSSSPNVDDAEPVTAPCREVAERDRDAFGDVRLAPVGGAELHRRRDVEHEPGDEHALGEVDAHVRLARARGHVPVDAAHVVARDVRPDLRELRARRRGRASGSRPRAAPRSAARS